MRKLVWREERAKEWFDSHCDKYEIKRGIISAKMHNKEDFTFYARIEEHAVQYQYSNAEDEAKAKELSKDLIAWMDERKKRK